VISAILVFFRDLRDFVIFVIFVVLVVAFSRHASRHNRLT